MTLHEFLAAPAAPAPSGVAARVIDAELLDVAGISSSHIVDAARRLVDT